MENQDTASQMPGMPSEVKPSETMPGMPTVDLNPPSHDEGKPIIDNVDKNISNNVDIPLVPKTGIKVIATRAGFFNQHRKAEGDKFSVPTMEKLGDWMKCVDPVLEKKRKELISKKKRGE